MSTTIQLRFIKRRFILKNILVRHETGKHDFFVRSFLFLDMSGGHIRNTSENIPLEDSGLFDSFEDPRPVLCLSHAC
jgi:hypothetical protein